MRTILKILIFILIGIIPFVISLVEINEINYHGYSRGTTYFSHTKNNSLLFDARAKFKYEEFKRIEKSIREAEWLSRTAEERLKFGDKSKAFLATWQDTWLGKSISYLQYDNSFMQEDREFLSQWTDETLMEILRVNELPIGDYARIKVAKNEIHKNQLIEWALKDKARNKLINESLTRNEIIITMSLMNIISSPFPLLYALGVYYVLKSFKELFFAIFKKMETKSITKKYSIRIFIIMLLFIIAAYIGDVMELQVAINFGMAGFGLLLVYAIFFVLIDVVWRNKQKIWSFLKNK